MSAGDGLRQRQAAAVQEPSAAALSSAQGVPPRRKLGSQARLERSKSIQRLELETWDSLPDHLRDNEFIVGSYRTEQSVWDSLKTLFFVHNETGNVWTHFLGFFLFLGLAYYFARHPPTPLAVTADHLDGLLHDLGAELTALHLGDRAHALGGRIAALEGRLLHAASDVGHTLQGVGHTLSEAGHTLQDNLQHVSHALSGNMAQLGEQLQHGLHSVEAGLTSTAAQLGGNLASRAGLLRAVLRQQLQPIVQWPTPRWPVYVYFGGACACLLTSGVCHLLGCCKRHIAEMVWRFDYAGIAVLIVASFVPSMYYAFLCEPFYRNFYLATTLAMGVVVVGLSLPSCFQARQFRALRAALFTLLGAWGVVPVSQLLLHHGHVWAIRTAFQLDLLMGAIYVAGAVIYACRVPERWYPGKFDIAGHSHQLWHAAVVLAAWVHYIAIMRLLQWRDAAGGCAAPGAVNGPVAELLGALEQQGRAPLRDMEALVDSLHAHLARHAAAAAGAAVLGPAGPPAAAM